LYRYTEVAWWDLAAVALGPQPAFRVVILGEDTVLSSGAKFLKASAPRWGPQGVGGGGSWLVGWGGSKLVG
jgi:hypothetical protein